MRDSNLPHYVGLDIGSHTVRCVIGVLDQEDTAKLSVIGYGSAPNMGMRKGVVVQVEDVASAMVHAVTEAERLSGLRISRATVNVNGVHVNGINSRGVIAISAANREITQEDRMRVEEAATIVQLPPNREIVQVFAKNYRLDGQDNIKDPIGMRGVRLEVDTHLVTAATPNMRNLEAALERAQLQATHRTVSGLAAAEAVLTRQQKEAGALLIDIGAGTTNLAVIEDGEVQHVAVLPIGGMHITNDLAIGLQTDLDVAEQVKLQHAGLGDHASKREIVKVRVNEQDFNFRTADVTLITEARTEELFEYIDKELHKIRRSQKLPGGVVIVGGTAKLPGITDFAKQRLRLSAHIGSAQSLSGLVETINDPAFCTAAGLMTLDMLFTPQEQPDDDTASKRVVHLVDDILKRFRKQS